MYYCGITGDPMETVTMKLTPRLIHELDELVEHGWYTNRSEAIRDGIRTVIEKHRYEMMKKAVKEDIEWARNVK